MIITYINYPYVYTDIGKRINIEKIEGNPVVGSQLVENDYTYKVMAATSDSECVNGVCPVR